VLGALVPLAMGLGITGAAPASASELPTQYQNYTHCAKRDFVRGFVYYDYRYQSSTRAGTWQYYRATSVVPSGPFNGPNVDTWWLIVRCGPSYY
jgi:hypothetical protein